MVVDPCIGVTSTRNRFNLLGTGSSHPVQLVYNLKNYLMHAWNQS